MPAVRAPSHTAIVNSSRHMVRGRCRLRRPSLSARAVLPINDLLHPALPALRDDSLADVAPQLLGPLGGSRNPKLARVDLGGIVPPDLPLVEARADHAFCRRHLVRVPDDRPDPGAEGKRQRDDDDAD